MTEEQVRAIVREEMRRADRGLPVGAIADDPLDERERHPMMVIARNHDAEGRPLFEVDGKVIGPADGVLEFILNWKRTEGGKAVWAQVDAFRDAFVRL